MAKAPDHNLIAALVHRAKQKDSDAFAELYGMTYNKVYNYACHYLKDMHLAQDAVQEVYISALKNLDKLNDPLLFVAWLNQISFHVCYDLCEKRNSGYGVIEDEILELFTDDSPNSNPEDATVHSDESRRLKESIERLPLHEREVITLRFFNNMKIDEIVKVTGSSKSTVKRYLASAEEHLREYYKE